MMWHQAKESREPTKREKEFLEERNWWSHGKNDWTCWHHPGFDTGNEPFTTQDALINARCGHADWKTTSHGVKFCAYCGVEKLAIDMPKEYAEQTGTWYNG